MRSRYAACVAALAACGTAADEVGASAWMPGAGDPSRPLVEAAVGAAGGEDRSPGAAVPYPSAIAKSTHNAYARAEPLLDQLLYHRIRSLELDVHASKAGASSVDADWFVYHEDLPFFRDTSCTMASDCLAQLAAFHRAIPEHEVVTLFVDLKEDFGDRHTPADLDALLAKSLGRGALFAPADAMERCATAHGLRDALAGACTFPTLAELRGKFIVAVTGGRACDPASLVEAYRGDRAVDRLAFAAPNVDPACPISMFDGAADGPVFANMSWEARGQAADVRSRGLVGRIYRGGIVGGLNTEEELSGARAAGASHLATDKASFEQDAWSKTHDEHGFPFACEGCEGVVEAGDVTGIRANSGDLWGTEDSAYFATTEGQGAETWSALVSVPSSHVAPDARGCLVARASDAADAAYVAVCRPFDASPPRMQVRSHAGGETSASGAVTFPGVIAEAAAMLRLSIAPRGAITDVTAQASADGIRWVTLGTTSVSGALPVRGVAVSSHDPTPVKALFAGLTRTSPGQPPLAVTLASLANKKPVGAGAYGEAFHGVGP